MSRTTPGDHPPASTPGKVAGALLLVVVAFQAALAAGAPWGEATQGGANPGVLPEPLRLTSALGAVVYLALAGVAGTRWAPPLLRRRVLHVGAAVMVVGALLNIASPSFIERMIWVPVTVALMALLWRAARHDSLLAGSDSPVRRVIPA